MKLKKRNLNSHEKYACSIKAVKNIFGDENVYVNFGFRSRDFQFDTFDQKRPKIKGTVIASASINKRDNIPESIHFISFYVIKDIKYSPKDEETFVEIYLPLLYKWYKEMLVRPETSPSGVETFRIEWLNCEFRTCSYRFH